MALQVDRASGSDLSNLGAKHQKFWSEIGVKSLIVDEKNLHSQSEFENKQKSREHLPEDHDASYTPVREQPRRDIPGRRANFPERPQKDTEVNSSFESRKPENAVSDNRPSWRNTVVAPGNKKKF
ncbi:hypothetical protein JTB14_019512 [Gonioctena quinquepunctata]|nr:hypothetical protein JTB14_019512 [Gonioctena quinquepunctata]